MGRTPSAHALKTFVRLKLALLRGGLRSGNSQNIIGLILGLVVAGGGGLAVGAALLGTRSLGSTEADDTVTAAFSVLLLLWVTGPVVAFGSDTTLSPDRLSLLPLGPRRLMPGLLAASVVGAGGLGTVLIVSGAVGGQAPASPAAIITMGAGVVQVLLCVCAGRVVTTALAAASRSRRWRDLTLLIGPLAVLGLNLAFQFTTRQAGNGGVELPDWLRTGLRWMPSGLTASAVRTARDGGATVAVAYLAAAVIVLVALLRLWFVVLQRVLTTATESKVRRPGHAPGLFPRWARFLPRNRLGAVTAKELRLSWREPRQRVALFGTAVLTFLPLVTVAALEGGSSTAVFLAVVPAFMMGATATNQYGFDGAAHWANVAAGDDAAADLAGKNLARALEAVLLTSLAAIAIAIGTGGWTLVLPALALAAAAFGLTLGPGNVTSVTVPVPLPDDPTNPFAMGNAGQGMAAVGPSILVLLVGGTAVAFLAVPHLLADGRTVVLLPLMVVDLAIGVGAWWCGWRIAVRRSYWRQPELLEALGRQQAA